MKKIIFSTVFFLFSASLFAQPANHERSTSDKDYLHKSKSQKKTAWILLAGGAGLIITAFIIPDGPMVETGCNGIICYNEHKNADIQVALFIAGSLATLTSIPFFIASKKNKKKATSLSFKMENTIQLYNQKMVSVSFPALKIKLNL